jgi:type IV pilus assembly protein PilW
MSIRSIRSNPLQAIPAGFDPETPSLPDRRAIRHNRPQRGFSLVELMIALMLSSFLAVGISQLFIANATTYKLLQGESLIQDSGRFSLDFISQAAERAGYTGCFSNNEDIYKTFLPDVPYEFNVGVGLEGYEGGAASWTPDIEAVLPKTVLGVDTRVYVAGTDGAGNGIDTSNIVRGTDIVTFRYVSRASNRLAFTMPTSTEDIDVVTPASTFEFGPDYMAYIHDCEKGTIFRVTGITATGDIEHSGAVDPDGYTNSFARLGTHSTFDTDAYVSAIVTKTFFIAPGTGVNEQGNTPLSLWQKVGISAPVEIVEGVEDLQVLYGVDTDDDGIHNTYVAADSVTDFDNVVMVRISVTANSVNDVGGTSTPTHGCVAGGGSQYCLDGHDYDGLLRRTFIQTVALRNKS